MKTGLQQKLPEEIELEQKRSDLAALSAQHAAARSVLQKMRDEIARFEMVYEQTLGWRLAELDRIEDEISGLGGLGSRDKAREGYPGQDGGKGYDWRRFQGGTAGNASGPRGGGTGKDKGRGAGPDELEIRALYREVAKAIHPDLAGSGSSGLDRNELMARANRAYAQQDRRTLQEILHTWNRSPEKVSGDDLAAELIRVIRQIARERQGIQEVTAQVEELKGSYAHRFKLKVDQDLAKGSDLFAEMVAAADLNIARALRRLKELKGVKGLKEEVPREPVHSSSQERRVICFPEVDIGGTIFLRDRASANFSQWKKVGPAKGRLEIEDGKAVRLDVTKGAAVNLSQLRLLKADDLQSLFLYEVGDDDLDCIMHLTGLEELCLSGLKLTDAALSGLGALTNLTRLYLYQTVITDQGLVHLQRLPGLKGLTSSGNSITDEGLSFFQRAIPGVKTVSFPWKYGRKTAGA